MLRAEELMVGDFILVERNEGIYGGPVWKQPGKVLEIYQDEIKVLFADENGDNEYDEILSFLPHEVDGLPITPEILEKNGFIKDKDDEHQKTYHLLVPTGFEKDSHTIKVTLYTKPICGVNVLFKCWGFVPPYNGGLNDIHLCGISFVHQMQHAIRLCGIDKTIEL